MMSPQMRKWRGPEATLRDMREEALVHTTRLDGRPPEWDANIVALVDSGKLLPLVPRGYQLVRERKAENEH